MTTEVIGTIEQGAGSKRQLLRSGGALLAGLVTVAGLSVATDAVLHGVGFYPPLDQAQPPWPLAVALAYRTIFTVAGGYLTARLAPDRGLGHAVALGGIGTVLAALGAISAWHFGEHWYPIALIVLAVPSTSLGGWLHARR